MKWSLRSVDPSYNSIAESYWSSLRTWIGKVLVENGMLNEIIFSISLTISSYSFSFRTSIHSQLFSFSLCNSSINRSCCYWSITANPTMELAKDSSTSLCLLLFSNVMEVSTPSTCEGGGWFCCEAVEALFWFLVLTIREFLYGLVKSLASK